MDGGAAGGFASPDELNRMVNAAVRRLYNKLVMARGHYYASAYTIATVNGTELYDLPTDFFQLLSVSAEVDSGYWCDVETFELREEHRLRGVRHGAPSTTRYTLLAQQLLVLPTPTQVFNLRLRYIPTAPELTSDSSTFDAINGFEDHAVLSVAIRLLAKEESDTRALEGERVEIEQQIAHLAPNRNAGGPAQVVDVNHYVQWPELVRL